MTNDSTASLSDAELLAETARAADVERRSTAELLALLAEVDLRKLYLGLGYASLFTYCTKSLHLSESAAYARITAARASRSFPNILRHVSDGTVTLTTVSLLAAHLTAENHNDLLSAASHKSRREVEQLVASLVTLPDVASSVRRLPGRSTAGVVPAPAPQPAPVTPPQWATSGAPPMVPPLSASPTRRTIVAPVAADRYLLRVTLSMQAHEKLERARALLRHQIPNGDPAAIVERALTVLVEQLERTKHASTLKPRKKTSTSAGASTSRHVPAAVKRAVRTRDSGRCAFVGADGRCEEAGFLEFHHVVPFAAGGATNTENLQLRCRTHNAYEATLFEQSAAVVRHPPSRHAILATMNASRVGTDPDSSGR
jgi:hypothetical protein